MDAKEQMNTGKLDTYEQMDNKEQVDTREKLDVPKAVLKERKKSYSDLECIITSSIADRQSYWNAKFAVDPTEPLPHAQGSEAPEAVIQPNDTPTSASAQLEKAALDMKALFDSSPVDTMAPAPPAYFLVDSKGQTQALYTAPSNSSDAASIANFKGRSMSMSSPVMGRGPPSAGGWWNSLGEGKRVCGLRKNMCLAVVAGVCALILGLLVTILVVTHPKEGDDSKHGNGNGDKDSSSSNPMGDGPFFATQTLLSLGDAGPMMAASNIAAMNWTLDGQSCTGVFYQSSSTSDSALMVAIKNDANQTWTTVNISASATTTRRLDVLPGTPLAAASNNGLWNLFYLTSANTIAEVYSNDPLSPSGWLQGEFAAKLAAPEVLPNSGLGAMWQQCEACDNALLVAWQNAQSGALVYANMTNLTWGEPVLIDDQVTPGTSISINAFTDTGKSVGADHDALRFYYTDAFGLEEIMKGPLGGGELIQGLSGRPVSDNISLAPAAKHASLTYGIGEGVAGWNNILLSWIDPYKGTLNAANYVNGAAYNRNPPSLLQSPMGVVEAGFSAVAMTHAMNIYLLSPLKGQIHEYSTNSTNALEWVWQETVDI